MQKQALTINEAVEYSVIGRNTLCTLIGWAKIQVIQIGDIVPLTLEHLFQNMADKDYNTSTGTHMSQTLET